MAVKFTHNKKWDDVWFSELSIEQKVMFMYLCDMCDIAGFLEINERLIKFHTGIDDVIGIINSLSKSVVYKDGYIWIKKHIKHQKNLPINPKNNAHRGIIKSILEHYSFISDIQQSLKDKDFNTIMECVDDERGSTGANEPLVSPTGKGKGISNSNSKDVIDVIDTNTLIPRLYKYFVGEENLTGRGITSRTRDILVEALKIMDVEEWKPYCEARRGDEFKASPSKFFLEDGWRRFQDNANTVKKEKKQAESRRKEVEKRRSIPLDEAPTEFKEFVKNLGKRTGKTQTTPTTSS